ncbi:SRPBCC family protein [Pedobacter cryophilus]|uniref:SRPBCC family protein n=1 Tax=Pedobacter cryophilus TaxID=2571271 RepID=A0A4U1C618_9SPHI|nr:hypothetical protein [Pedobacter cryophilus]TKC00883.1 hypothetical protein FA046_04190 [Pedobacter cryophilus]
MKNDRRNKTRNYILAILIPCVIGWIFSYLATNIFIAYSYGLFIWLPFVMGFSSTMLLAHNNESRTKYDCLNISFFTLFIYCLGLLTFAFEGLICIVMAAPIGLLFNWLGFLVAWKVVNKKIAKNLPTTLSILILSVPTLMGFEFAVNKNEDQLRSVKTLIEIKATPEKVWQNVIEFPQLKKPTEFIFKTGIAYPINAKINGKGIGAVRHCNFSTGSFVEPITVWDEPKLLKFNVVDQPETMKEISFYDVHPNHLNGYFVSRQGQFKLTSLPNGNTLLEGTTWYFNRIKPNIYWTIWSDFIIHKIHERVLNHIKEQSENI